MKIALIQLSDIHISIEKWPKNPVLERGDAIVAAVRSLFLTDVAACVLLISGDIAYAGLEAEYELAESLLARIRDDLSGLYGADKLHVVVLPGNHDCDFRLDTDARRQLIAGDMKGFADGSVADICTKVQESFFAFCQRLEGHAKPVVGVDRFFEEHSFSLGTEEMSFRVINTAWCSREKEKAGTLVLPTDILKRRLMADGSAQLVVTAMHHPYSWLEPTNGREARRLIDQSSDMVFTGHEHESESYAKSGFTGQHNEYIEAGPLQETSDPSKSEFNAVVIDTKDAAYTVHHFAWDGEIYEQVNQAPERPFIRNNARLQGEFQINQMLKEELNDTDVVYLHAFKDPVLLEDIFLYPDLKEFSPTAGLGKTKNKGPSIDTRRDYNRAPAAKDDSG